MPHGAHVAYSIIFACVLFTQSCEKVTRSWRGPDPIYSRGCRDIWVAHKARPGARAELKKSKFRLRRISRKRQRWFLDEAFGVHVAYSSLPMRRISILFLEGSRGHFLSLFFRKPKKQRFRKTRKIKESIPRTHTRTQTRGVPEGGKSNGCLRNSKILHAFLATPTRPTRATRTPVSDRLPPHVAGGIVRG